jgi:hypothetical protein
MSDDFFAPPTFKPEEALQSLRRQLRELRGLAERNGRFEAQGKVVLQLTATAHGIEASLAKRPALQPDFERFELKDSAAVRKLLETVRKRLAAWDDERA